jgi:hypothetical protein
MRLRLFAAAASALIMLGSGQAGATGAQAGHGGESAYNGSQNTDSNQSHNIDVNNESNKNASYNSNSRTNTARNDSRASARASAHVAAGAGSGSGGGSSSVSAEGDDTPASGAAAVYVTTSDDTCMGSSGVGGQGDAFGFSVASAWTDSNCIMLKNARELNAQGYPKAARARLCMNEENALAFELAGQPCPRALPSTQAALAKIRAADPAYLAAAEVPVQLAMAGDAGGMSSAGGGADGGGADGAPQAGSTLLAMVHTAVQTVAAAFAASSAGADPEPYTLYGIE